MDSAQIQGCARIIGQARLRKYGKSRSHGGDRVGGARVSKTVTPWTENRNLESPTAQRLGYGSVRTRTVENDMRRDAAAQRALPIEFPHAAQVAFALLNDVADKNQWNGQFHSCIRRGVSQRVNNGQQTSHASSVVACAWSGQEISVEDRIERRLCRKNRIEVR